MKQFKDMKLGDKIPQELLKDFEGLFEGEVRLLRISYTIQDKDGVTIDIKLEHKDFYEEDAKQEEAEP